MRMNGQERQSYEQLVPDWGARQERLTVSHFAVMLTTKSRFTLRLQNFSIKTKRLNKNMAIQISCLFPTSTPNNIIYACSEPKGIHPEKIEKKT